MTTRRRKDRQRGSWRGWRGIPIAAAMGHPGGFDPLSLSPHLWLDPSDLSTMFQTDDTSTPVTADGQTVGRIHDKSGNGFHVIQATAGKRPLYKTSGGLSWLLFDGTDDFLAVSFAQAQPVTRVTAIRVVTDAIVNLVAGGLVIYSTNDGNLHVNAGGDFSIAYPGAGTDFVVTEIYNGASSKVAIDNGSYTTGDAGANAATGYEIAAAGGASPANMRYSGGVAVARVLTDPEIAKLRTYLAAKQGRVL